MLLYHGTSIDRVDRILCQGLLPRQNSGNSNYSISSLTNYESRHDAVYLSDAYAAYYANNFHYGALIEINIDSLEEDNFYPDEDFLVQTLHLPTEAGETIEERTQYAKENLKSYHYLFTDSLQKMGSCSYIGNIPPSAISRITSWCCNEVQILRWWSRDYIYSPSQGGVVTFKEQNDADLLHLLTKCFAKREFELDKLVSLLEVKCKQNNIINGQFCYFLNQLFNKGYFYPENPLKDALIQEIDKIIVYYENQGI